MITRILVSIVLCTFYANGQTLTRAGKAKEYCNSAFGKAAVNNTDLLKAEEIFKPYFGDSSFFRVENPFVTHGPLICHCVIQSDGSVLPITSYHSYNKIFSEKLSSLSRAVVYLILSEEYRGNMIYLASSDSSLLDPEIRRNSKISFVVPSKLIKPNERTDRVHFYVRNEYLDPKAVSKMTLYFAPSGKIKAKKNQ